MSKSAVQENKTSQSERQASIQEKGQAEVRSSGSDTADIVVDRLIAWGVDTIFGVIGAGINPLMESLRQRRKEIRYIAVRHEEAAAFMASGYAKYTGRIGACIATSGPGAIHLMNGLYDAAFDHAPVIAITGLPVHDLIGSQFMQDVDTVSMMKDVAGCNAALSGPQQALTLVDLACRTALSTSSVSHIAISKDVQQRTISEDKASKKRGNLMGGSSWLPRIEVPGEEHLAAAAELLNSASKPMILAGKGALAAGAEIEQLAELLGAPVAKALLGRTSLADDSPYTTGGIGDLGTLPSKQCASECDALLILGSTMPYLDYYPEVGQARCVQIDRDPVRIGLRHPAEVGLTGDCAATLRELLPRIRRNENRDFLTTAQKRMAEWRKKLAVVEAERSVPLKPQFVVSQISRLLSDDALISLDTGAHTIFCGRHLQLRASQRLIVSGMLASMGPAMPYAIAAKLAYPDRQCVALAGDGGFTMLMGELITAVKYKTPIKIVIFKNNSLAQDAWEQMEAGQEEFGAELEPIDFVKFAEACGVEAYRCEKPEEVESNLKKAFASPNISLVEVKVDPKEWPVKPQDVG